MKSLKLSLVLQLLVIFASGAVVGALGHRFYSRQQASAIALERPKGARGGGDMRGRYVESMRARLNLTEEQVRGLNAIYADTERRFAEVRKRSEADPTVQQGFAKMRELTEAAYPEIQAIGKDQIAQIRAMLDEAQRAEYDKILKERDANGKRRGGRGEGAPPPGSRGGRSGGPPPGFRP